MRSRDALSGPVNNFEVRSPRRRKRPFLPLLAPTKPSKVPSPRRPSKDPTGSGGDDLALSLSFPGIHGLTGLTAATGKTYKTNQCFRNLGNVCLPLFTTSVDLAASCVCHNTENETDRRFHPETMLERTFPTESDGAGTASPAARPSRPRRDDWRPCCTALPGVFLNPPPSLPPNRFRSFARASQRPPSHVYNKQPCDFV